MNKFRESQDYNWDTLESISTQLFFMLSLKRGEETLIFLNNGDGSTCTFSYPRECNLAKEIGSIQRVFIHRKKKKVVIQILSSNAEGLVSYLIGEEPNPSPVVAKLYVSLKKSEFLMATLVEFKDHKQSISFRSVFSNARDFFKSEIITTIAENTPSHEELCHILDTADNQILLDYSEEREY